MKLEPLYRAEFGYPEAWAVDVEGPSGTEGQHFVIDVAELVWEPVAD